MLRRSRSPVPIRPATSPMPRVMRGREAPELLMRDQRRDVVRRALLAVFAIVLIGGIGVSTFWLQGRSFDISRFLPQIEARIDEALGEGGTLSFSKAFLDLDLFGGETQVRFEQPIAIIGGQPAPVYGEALEVKFSPWMIATGQLRATDIQLSGVELAFDGAGLLPDASSTPAPDFFDPGDAPTSGTTEHIVELAEGAIAEINSILRPLFDQFNAAGLSELAIADSSIRLDGFVKDGRDFRLNVGRARFVGDEGRVRFDLATELIGHGIKAPISLAFLMDQSGSLDELDFTVAPLAPYSFIDADQLPVFASTPVSAKGALTLADGGKIAQARFEFGLAEGDIGSKKKPLHRLGIENAKTVLSYDQADAGIRVDTIEMKSNGGRFSAFGTVKPRLGDPSGQSWVIGLQTRDFVFSDGSQTPPVSMTEGRIEGIVDFARSQVDMHRVDLISERVEIAMTVGFGWGDGEQSFEIDGVFSEMTVADLRHIWIPPIGAKARQWFREHAKKGRIDPGTFSVFRPPDSLRQPGMPPALTRIETTIHDGLMTYFRDLPAIRVPKGQMLLESKIFQAQADQGSMITSGGRLIEISDGTVRMDGLGFPEPDMELTASIVGSASAMVDFASEEALNEAKSIPFSPEAVEGETSGNLRLGMKMSPDPERAGLTYTVRGEVTDFSSNALFDDRSLTKGRLTVELDRLKFEGQGPITVDGAPGEVKFVQQVSDKPIEGKGFELALRMDADAQKKFGLTLGDFGDGPFVATITQLGNSPQSTTIAIDLTEARSEIAPIGWLKGPGQPAKMSFSVPSKGKANRLSNFRFDGPGLDLEGEVLLGDSGQIASADFSVFRLSANDRVKVRYRNGGNQSSDIAIQGSSFDARPIIRLLRGSRESTGSGGSSISVDVANVAGFNGTSLTDFQLSMAQSAGRISNLSLAGNVNGANPLTVISQGDGVVRVRSSDAGSVLRLLDLYDFGIGGDLDVSLMQKPAAGIDWTGKALITDFFVKDDPVFQRFVQQVRPDPEDTTRSQPPIQTQSGLAFSKFRASFNQSKDALNIESGTLKGPTVGTTFQGTYAARSKALDISGTFVPAFGLNNAFRQVPIIGAILGGRQDEGLFGITYRVRGTTDNPDLQINPLSAIAPGIFRRIFEFDQTGNGG